MEDTRKIINIEKINQAVDLIEQADAIIFSCLGSSCVAAEEAFMRFSRAGRKCIFYRDESSQLISTAIAGSRDVVIGISNSGRSTAVVQSLLAARKNGSKTIAVTAYEESPVVRCADVCLFTPTKNVQPGTGLDWESTASKIAQIYVLDIIYACYATRNHDKALKYLDATYEAIKNSRNPTGQ
jgi:DNA-binding MurR/RpiR family transcriptional regulator